ncbi:MAG: SMP-30/gluconolactonase/LRE family protein [Gammaproteobacteria bacterium]|nr:SMP-30/gluconolactonase/LRE family protein [Gammaproteobacteria bacterium]
MTDATRHPRGLVWSPDDGRLFFNRAEDMRLWSLKINENGLVKRIEPFGELFRGDRRYGETRHVTVPSTAEGMAIDSRRNLYVATEVGVQVFTPAGRLVGLISLPQLLPRFYYPPRPLSLSVGGPENRDLFMAWGEWVYKVALRSGS